MIYNKKKKFELTETMELFYNLESLVTNVVLCNLVYELKILILSSKNLTYRGHFGLPFTIPHALS